MKQQAIDTNDTDTLEVIDALVSNGMPREEVSFLYRVEALLSQPYGGPGWYHLPNGNYALVIEYPDAAYTIFTWTSPVNPVRVMQRLVKMGGHMLDLSPRSVKVRADIL